MKAARGYCRVSSEIQLSGISLELQQKKIEEFCDCEGFTLIKVYVDEALSGKDMKRPAIQLLLSELFPGETVVINDISRFTRNVHDCADLFTLFEEKGVNLISIDEHLDLSTSEGKDMLKAKTEVAQLEREQTSRKVTEAMNYLSERGELRCRPSFGWMNVGKGKPFKECPEQQAVIREIKEMHYRGMGLSQISKELNEKGLNTTLTLNKKSKAGRQIFYPQTVKRILIDCGLIEPSEKDSRTPAMVRLGLESNSVLPEKVSDSEIDTHARVIMSPTIMNPSVEKEGLTEVEEKYLPEKKRAIPVYRSSQEKIEKRVRVTTYVHDQQAKILFQQQEIRKMFEMTMQTQLAWFQRFEQNLNRYYTQLEELSNSL